jgi:hypothetical protein
VVGADVGTDPPGPDECFQRGANIRLVCALVRGDARERPPKARLPEPQSER